MGPFLEIKSQDETADLQQGQMGGKFVVVYRNAGNTIIKTNFRLYMGAWEYRSFLHDILCCF